MTKLMNKRINIMLDAETKRKLDKLSESSDKSKIIRSLILREWDYQHDSIRVPLISNLSNLDPINEIENRQTGEME